MMSRANEQVGQLWPPAAMALMRLSLCLLAWAGDACQAFATAAAQRVLLGEGLHL